MRPVMLALRFVLELAALAAALVLAAAGVWGRWMAPASGRRLADPLRLVAEVVFFAGAGVALGVTGRRLLGAALAVVAVANAGLLRLLHVNETPQR